MEKITRKAFIETLAHNESIFVGSVFNKSDEWIISAMEKMAKMPEDAPRRTVTSIHAQFIKFSNGSRLSWDQIGKYEHFRHMTKAGNDCIIQRLDDGGQKDYIVYVIDRKI